MLYPVLTLLLKGKVLGSLQSCEELAGRDAWNRLTHEFDLKVAGRFQGMLTSLLNPVAFKSSDPFRHHAFLGEGRRGLREAVAR